MGAATLKNIAPEDLAVLDDPIPSVRYFELRSWTEKKGFKGAVEYVIVCVCAPFVHVTYLATPGAVVAILAGATAGLDPSAAGYVAALPWRPGRPVDVWRAGQVFVTVPEEEMTTGDGNVALTKV